MSTVRILGIDPGSRITGYGIVDVDGNQCQYIASGCIRTRGDDFLERLREIFDGSRKLVKTYGPAEIAIERVFMHRNADSALKLGQARAASLCACFGSETGIYEYVPRQIKQAVVGAGAADKGQVAHMVKRILSLSGDLQADAADALAVAICHAHWRSTSSALDYAQEQKA